MKKRAIKWYNAALAAAMGMLGFTGCGDCGGQTPILYAPEPAYGVPYEVHTIFGKVSDVSGNPIDGIKVTVQQSEADGGTVYSNAEGDYSYVRGGPYFTPTYNVVFTDVDGEENGGDFKTTEESVVFTEEDYSDGAASKEVDVTMELKTTEEK